MAKENPAFMAGISELMILRLLQDREMYGYEIVQAIRASTHEVISLSEGVVYPLLHALEKHGALKSRRPLRTRLGGPHPGTITALTSKGVRTGHVRPSPDGIGNAGRRGRGGAQGGAHAV